MPEVNEKHVYNALLKYKGSGKLDIKDAEKDAEIILHLNPIDIHTTDSPDYLLWIDISLKLFGQNLAVKIPIPVEAEKGGIYGGALEDLKKFVERRNYPIELPMLVIAEAGYDTTEQKETFPVKFKISQIPVRLLEGK
ncbi:MAG: hypothetical protein WA102_05125 [Candidatus Methanoperedens sp.]